MTVCPHQMAHPHGCNKFEMITDVAITPLTITSWLTALAAVDDNFACVDVCYHSSSNCKYVFPKPGIFLAANPVQQAKYLSTWQSIEPACIYCIISCTVPPLSNQEWHDILIGNLDFKSPMSNCAKAWEQAFQLLGSAIDDLGINVTDPVSGTSTLSLNISDNEAWAILWHLSELNFRVVLLALHKCAGPVRNELEGDQVICDALEVSSLVLFDMNATN